ncbi:MAG: hypothetical protein AB7T74_03040 [Clostridia bacterium]
MKYLRFPNGYTGTVSDDVAAILCLRPGHRIVHQMPKINTAPPIKASYDENEKETNRA